MFLPILLLRDYGWTGLAIFLIPNAIGAAAMGWLLPGSPELGRLLTPHLPMIRWFTRITVAFHLYWIGMLASPVVPAFPGAWLAMPLVAIAGMLLGIRTVHRHGLAVAAVLWVLGLLLVVALLTSLGLPDLSLLNASPLPLEAMLAAPVIAIGFLACPYLDATFLVARHINTDANARGSFTLGFLGLFPVMIAATVLYAPMLSANSGGLLSGPHAILGLCVAVHLALQAGFTIAVHARSIDHLGRVWPASASRIPSPAVRAVIGARPASPTALLWLLPIGLLGLIVARLPTPAGLAITPAEIGYRVFLSCYGLAFPAYVWICMIGRDRRIGSGRPNRRNLTVTVIAVLLGAPCFAMGFVLFEAWWLVLGAAVLLMARLGRSSVDDDQAVRSSLVFGDEPEFASAAASRSN